jgi:hypothetical protein
MFDTARPQALPTTELGFLSDLHREPSAFDFLAVAGPLSTLKQPRNLELVCVATHRKADRDDIRRMHEVPRMPSTRQSFRHSTLEGA